MCTLVLLRRPGHAWPILVAANRDEMAGRPWKAPARHWPDRPEVTAGLDELAQGSWLGVNDHGVMAAILNRVGTLGPAAGKRSRGELVLDALDHADAVQAADALADLDGRAWRPFNMVVADNRDAFWIKSEGDGRVLVHEIPPGLHMISAMDLDDLASPRLAAYLPRFHAATPPDADADDWREWQALMADGGGGQDGEENAAMCFCRPTGFGTVSSSLIGLSSDNTHHPWLWLFADAAPSSAPYTRI
ncbi:MAG: NRDE family protein [Magnetospirillum sp.]